MDTVNGWPHSDVGPATPQPAVRALLPWDPDSPAVVVSATATTAEVWCLTPPSPAHVRAWETATGRIVSVVTTTPDVMAALSAARRSENFTTSWEDLLTHIGATFGDLAGHPWPRAASVTVRGGQAAEVRTAVGEAVAVSGGLWTAERVAALAADVGLHTGRRVVFAAGPSVRAVASGGRHRVHIRFKPATFPGIDAVGLPADAAALTAGGPAVVAVGSAAGGGRTCLAVALAVHTASRTGASIAAVGESPTWPGTDGADWTRYPGDPVRAISEAVDEGATVLCVDDAPSEDAHDPVWAGAARAAAGGATVFVTSRHAQLDGLAAAAAGAAPMLRGAVVRTLVGSGEPLAVDDTVVCTSELRRWLAANPHADLLYARDLHGHDAGHAYDTALGLAVAAGRISAADAAAWVREPARYAAGGGRAEQVEHRGPDGNWDWQTRTSNV